MDYAPLIYHKIGFFGWNFDILCNIFISSINSNFSVQILQIWEFCEILTLY
jgi:hypothetical protein